MPHPYRINVSEKLASMSPSGSAKSSPRSSLSLFSVSASPLLGEPATGGTVPMPPRLVLRVCLLSSLVVGALVWSFYHSPSPSLPSNLEAPAARYAHLKEYAESANRWAFFEAQDEEAEASERARTQRERGMWTCDRCAVAKEWCAQFGSRNMDLALGYEGPSWRAPAWAGVD